MSGRRCILQFSKVQYNGGMLMDEEKRQGKTGELAEEDLDQVSGGAFWYDAIHVMGSIRKKKGDDSTVSAEVSAEKQISEPDPLSGLAQGAEEVRKRLDRFAK